MKELLFNLPTSERKVFAKHFLSGVNVEIAFAESKLPQLFESLIDITSLMQELGFLENKPVLESKVAFQVAEPGGEQAKLEQESKTIGHTFRSKDMGMICDIQGDKVLLSSTEYKGFEQFSEILIRIVECVAKSLGDRVVVKVGLRKVNSIILENVGLFEEACSVFNKSVFGLLRSGLPTSSVKVTQEVLVLENGDALSVLRNSFRALEAKNTYEANLDFDVVNKKSVSTHVALSEELSELNAIHFDLFNWAVTDKMIKLMEEEG